ncbi:MAG TPA: SPW repeat protein [Thermoanaerobaculia bacterium]|nr:SPW repeat protein [Thermoanaerobaculia bacterium]
MWARGIEVMLGLWLVVSPFVFGHFAEPGLGRLVASDLAAGSLVVLLAVVSFWRRAGRAHLAELAVAGWLVAFGRFAFDFPPPPGAQNELLVGLVLVLFAIVPNRAADPPARWRAFYEERARRG